MIDAIAQARVYHNLSSREKNLCRSVLSIATRTPDSDVSSILPQEAGPGEVILSKRHELGLLSNFAATPFIFRGKRYASLEGFWQMMLYPEGKDDPRANFPGLEWKYTLAQVAEMSSFEAKSAGSLAEENITIRNRTRPRHGDTTKSSAKCAQLRKQEQAR